MAWAIVVTWAGGDEDLLVHGPYATERAARRAWEADEVWRQYAPDGLDPADEVRADYHQLYP